MRIDRRGGNTIAVGRSAPGELLQQRHPHGSPVHGLGSTWKTRRLIKWQIIFFTQGMDDPWA